MQLPPTLTCTRRRPLLEQSHQVQASTNLSRLRTLVFVARGADLINQPAQSSAAVAALRLVVHRSPGQHRDPSKSSVHDAASHIRQAQNSVAAVAGRCKVHITLERI